MKKIKAWVVLVPATNKPLSNLGLDDRAKFGHCRRFILPETKSGAQAMIKTNKLQRRGCKIVPVLISPIKKYRSDSSKETN